MKSLMTLS